MRLRDVVTALVGVFVLAGVVAIGWRWLEVGEQGADDPREEAERLAERYVDAWNTHDLTQMQSLVANPPEEFAERHEQLLEGTSATDFEVNPGEVDHSVEGRAVVPLTLRLASRELVDPVEWDSELVVLRERGEWTVVWTISTLHPEMRPSWEFGLEREDVGRRDILASDGTPLAGTGKAVTFGFQPALVDDRDEVVDAFADALPGSEATAKRELSRDDLNDGWFYPVVTVSASRADTAAPRLREATGILRRIDDEARVLHDDGFAQHTVGIVREATAEQLENLGELYEPGDEIGQYGLESVFEETLVGTEVVRAGLVEVSDQQMRHVLGESQERASKDVQTTISIEVQRAVERALEGIEAPAAIVVVDTSDGAIRAAASRPLSGYHRAFTGRYPPGSTFKIVTAEAALAAGYGLDDEIGCPAEAIVGGLQVTNSSDRELGRTTFAEAFAASCNTTFAGVGADLGIDALIESSQRFGFGAEYSLPLESYSGQFPQPADVAELAAASFGQARVQASALHMASVAAAVTAGAWHQPYLTVDDESQAVPRDRRPLAAGTTDPLRRLLEVAVVDGTGDAADVNGEVGGKTGTAQGADGVEHAWFVGVFEELGFAILVEGGGSGGEVAAPLGGRLVVELSSLLDVEGGAGADGATEDGESQDDEARNDETEDDADAIDDVDEDVEVDDTETDAG